MNTDLFKFPNSVLVFNADVDGNNVVFTVVSVGYLSIRGFLHHYRILNGLGCRLEIYDGDGQYLCQFHYECIHEVYADIMRFCNGQLELEFNDDDEVVGKIYKYCTE